MSILLSTAGPLSTLVSVSTAVFLSTSVSVWTAVSGTEQPLSFYYSAFFFLFVYLRNFPDSVRIKAKYSQEFRLSSSLSFPLPWDISCFKPSINFTAINIQESEIMSIQSCSVRDVGPGSVRATSGNLSNQCKKGMSLNHAAMWDHEGRMWELKTILYMEKDVFHCFCFLILGLSYDISLLLRTN